MKYHKKGQFSMEYINLEPNPTKLISLKNINVMPMNLFVFAILEWIHSDAIDVSDAGQPTYNK